MTELKYMVEEKKVVICRLCLNVVQDNSYEELKETHNIQIQYIIPDLNLSLNSNPLLCKACTDVLQEAYEFKTACVEVETYLEEFNSPTKIIDLNEVIAHKMLAEEIKREVKDMKEENKICRLCLGFIENKSFQEFGVTEENILQKCIPEMDLTITEDPVSCENCMGYLHSQFNFVMRCLDADETINNYINSQGVNSGNNLNLHDVVQFMTRNNQREEINNCESNFMELESKNCTPLSQSSGMYEQDVLDDMKIDPLVLDIKNTSTLEVNDKKSSDLQKHQLTHKNSEETKMHQCPNCSFKSKRKGNMLMHMIRHKEPDPFKMHKCPECRYEGVINNLRKHILKHQSLSEDAPMHKCTECDFQTRWKAHLRRHIEVLHKGQVTLHKCEHCPYIAMHKDNLRKHLLTHKHPSEVKMHKCDLCDFQSKRKDKIKQHMSIMHDCTECDFQAKEKEDLVAHLKTHKSPKQIFKCDICSYESRQKRYLQMHKRIHVVEDPNKIVWIKCEFCPYQAKRKDVLNKHLLIHKDPSQVKMHQCPACTYKSKWKHNLLMHQKLHCKGDSVKKECKEEVLVKEECKEEITS